MLIRKATFEKLLKRMQKQEQEIENLNEKLGIKRNSSASNSKLNVGEGWKLSEIPQGSMAKCHSLLAQELQKANTRHENSVIKQ